MINFIEISGKRLKEIVRMCYDGDDDMLNKYHIKKLTLDEAVDSTIGMILDAHEEIELDYVEVVYDGATIGYLVISGSFLYSFAVAVRFRKKQIMHEWFLALQALLGDGFSVGLLSNNTRAIDYFLRRGLSIAWQNPDNKQNNEVLLMDINNIAQLN